MKEILQKNTERKGTFFSVFLKFLKSEVIFRILFGIEETVKIDLTHCNF